jgi:hypothetical protein
LSLAELPTGSLPGRSLPWRALPALAALPKLTDAPQASTSQRIRDKCSPDDTDGRHEGRWVIGIVLASGASVAGGTFKPGRALS